MSFEPEFWTMMVDRVRIEPYVGQNQYGEPTYGAAVEFPCRVSGKALALRRPTDENKTPIFDIWAMTEGTYISVQDRITIMGGDSRWTAQGKLVLFAVGQYTDDSGVHHTKMQCGWIYHRQGQ